MQQATWVSFALQNGLLKHALSGLRTRGVAVPVHLSYPQRIRIAHDLFQAVLHLQNEAPVSGTASVQCTCLRATCVDDAAVQHLHLRCLPQMLRLIP